MMEAGHPLPSSGALTTEAGHPRPPPGTLALGPKGPGEVQAWGPGEVVPASGPKGSGEVQAWGTGDMVPARQLEGLDEVQVLKPEKVCSAPPPAALVTCGKTPEAEELLLCRPRRLQPWQTS